MSAVVRNRFYFHIAVVLALLLTFAFMRTFYARPLFDLPPLPTLLHVHGAVFTAWFLLFVAQTRLIAANNYQAHRALGLVGALLAATIIVVGTMTAFESVLATRPRGGGLTSPQFALVPLTDIVFFTGFVGAALALRRRAALHKRFMVLAMISVLGPAVGRLIGLAGAREYFLVVQTSVPALFVAWCLINDWRKHHIVHPVFLYGGALLVISWPVRVALAKTDAWAVVSGAMVRFMS